MGPNFEQKAERVAFDLDHANERNERYGSNEREAGTILHNEIMSNPRESLALIQRARSLEHRQGVDDLEIGRDGSVAMINKYNHHISVVGHEPPMNGMRNQYPEQFRPGYPQRNPQQFHPGYPQQANPDGYRPGYNRENQSNAPFSQYENLTLPLNSPGYNRENQSNAPFSQYENLTLPINSPGYNQEIQQTQAYNGSWNQGGYNPAANSNYGEQYAMNGQNPNPSYPMEYQQSVPPPVEAAYSYPQYAAPALSVNLGGYGGYSGYGGGIGRMGWGHHMPPIRRGFNLGGLSIEF